MAHDVFISHSSKDKLTADAICHSLEQNGIRCWIAPRDVRAGFKFGEEIIKAIKECKIFLLVFSDESNKSEAVKKEIERAVLGYKKTVIPFRIGDVEMNENIEFFLGNIHWIDAYPNDKVFTNLVTAVKNALGIPIEEKSKIPVSEGNPIQRQVNRNPINLSKLLKLIIPAAIVIVVVIFAVILFRQPKVPIINSNSNALTENLTKFTPKIISLDELKVVHSPLHENDYFQSKAEIMENMLMLQMGEWLYFKNPKDLKLYKIKVNGEELSCVSKGYASQLSTFNGYIYYVDAARDNRIFRTNGEESKIFLDKNIQYSYTLTPKGLVYFEKIFTGLSWGERCALIDYDRMVDMSIANLIFGDPCSDENNLFFTKYEEGANYLYRVDFDGTNMQKICDANIYRIAGVHKGYIYFINKDDSNKLYKVYADGTQLTDLGVSEGFNLAVIRDDGLYYNNMYSGIIKRYNFNNKENELLLKIVGKATNTFSVIGNWMFITIAPEQQEEWYLCRMNLIDGTFETIAKL